MLEHIVHARLEACSIDPIQMKRPSRHQARNALPFLDLRQKTHPEIGVALNQRSIDGHRVSGLKMQTIHRM